jgi:hypothetical protein
MESALKVRRVADANIDDTDTGDELSPENTMTDQQRLSLYVRTVLCGAGCFFPDYKVSSLARRFKCGVSAAHDGQMTTWIPKTHSPILIIGTDTHENIVVVCRTGDTYKMSLAFGVATLPPGVVLVCNCTVNRDGKFQVLVYDGENLPLNSGQSGHTAVGEILPTSIERYQRLRDFFPKVFHHSELAVSTFMIQWVGYYQHARQFLTGEIPVPHDITGLLSTTDDPMTPTRPVSIKIPNLVIKRFNDPA